MLEKWIVKKLFRLILSCFLSFILIAAWAAMAEVNGWLHFTGWGMAHGGILLALPACWIASYAALGFIPWFRRK